MFNWFKKEVLKEFPKDPEEGDIFERKRHQFWEYTDVGWLPYTFCVECGDKMIGQSKVIFKKCAFCEWSKRIIIPPARPRPKPSKISEYFRIMGAEK
jgi:hypothetical protein